MYYDLHIHSSLSPCSDDDMTVNNIINMAIIKELELIAITDHNSLLQNKALRDASENKIKVLYGAELESIEEVHCLALFDNYDNEMRMNQFIEDKLIKEFNDYLYYGHQYVMDENDNIIREYPYLLIKSLEIRLKDLIDVIHEYHGIAILAHIYARRYSVHYSFKKIKSEWNFDGVEVNKAEDIIRFKEEYPEYKDRIILVNSDAHSLYDINERENDIDYKILEERFEKWRN